MDQESGRWLRAVEPEWASRSKVLEAEHVDTPGSWGFQLTDQRNIWIRSTTVGLLRDLLLFARAKGEERECQADANEEGLNGEWGTRSTEAILLARWRAWALAFPLRSRSFRVRKGCRTVGVALSACQDDVIQGGDVR